MLGAMIVVLDTRCGGRLREGVVDRERGRCEDSLFVDFLSVLIFLFDLGLVDLGLILVEW